MGASAQANICRAFVWSGKCPSGICLVGKCPSGMCLVGEVSVGDASGRGSVRRGNVRRECDRESIILVKN